VTSCGTIVVRLDAKDVPIAVNNFVFLAEHHLYDGTWFHRILSTFVIQGGDPKGDGTGGPGYQFTTETNPTTKFADASGLFAYANSGPDTNGSQFFITLAKLPNLDPPNNGPYTIFGTVTQGSDVVKKIAAVPTTANPNNPQEQSKPLEAVYVISVKISVSK
jgi:cyclophilin family peptidyl-prolyl cis-trans isomerase